jgi:hypothetical protein
MSSNLAEFVLSITAASVAGEKIKTVISTTDEVVKQMKMALQIAKHGILKLPFVANSAAQVIAAMSSGETSQEMEDQVAYLMLVQNAKSIMRNAINDIIRAAEHSKQAYLRANQKSNILLDLKLDVTFAENEARQAEEAVKRGHTHSAREFAITTRRNARNISLQAEKVFEKMKEELEIEVLIVKKSKDIARRSVRSTNDAIYAMKGAIKELRDIAEGLIQEKERMDIEIILKRPAKDLFLPCKRMKTEESVVETKSMFEDMSIIRLEELWEDARETIQPDALNDFAAEKNEPAILGWVLARFGPRDSFMFSVQDKAASVGHHKIFEWLYENEIAFSPKAYIIAAETGQVFFLLRLLCMHMYSDIENLRSVARKNGHLLTVELLCGLD